MKTELERIIVTEEALRMLKAKRIGVFEGELMHYHSETNCYAVKPLKDGKYEVVNAYDKKYCTGETE